jgi:hypothetical protein
MNEVEKKVNTMIGKYTMNEYEAYKNLLKHKKKINRVFSKICGEKSFPSRRPGPPVKMPCVAVASCSTAPLKALRKKSSKKSQGTPDETTSSGVQPAKTRSLESTKRKRRTSEQISDVELQAASSLAQMSRKKAKKAVKKIVAAEVRRVPSAFDDDIFAEPSQKGFSSWPFLRFNFHEHYTPSSENEFVDVGSFSDVAAEVQNEVVSAIIDETPTAVIDTVGPQSVHHQEEASPEFMKELELTVHRGEDPIQDAPLLQICEDLPKGQAPSPSLAAFNKSFGTSYRGELLSVGCKAASIGDGTSKILTLWKSPTLVDETGEGASEQTSRLPGETARDSGKKPCTSSKKTLVSSGKPSASSRKKINSKDPSKKGSLLFRPLRFPCFELHNLCTQVFSL